MTHSDWELQRERLSAYLDSELAPAERADLEAHLVECEQCQHELAALRHTRALLRALPTPALPRSFTLPTEPVVAGARRSRRSVPVWTRPVQAVGGIAAMVGLGLLVATALPQAARPMASGAATSAGESHTANGATVASPAGTSPTLGGATATSSASGPVYAPIHEPPNATHSQPVQQFPVAPVTGVTLLVGGAAALTAGGVARRRARRVDSAEPAA